MSPLPSPLIHPKRWLPAPLLLGAVVCLVTACGPKEADPTPQTSSFLQGSEDHGFVLALQSRVSQGQGADLSEVRRLKALALRYPGEELIEELQHSLLLAREDWEGMTTYYEAKANLGAEERLTLTRAHLRQMDYQGARQAIERYASGNPDAVEAQRLLARACYFLGDYRTAAMAYGRVWDQMLAQGLTTDLAYRAMIHFEEGEVPQALGILQGALRATPNSVTVLNSLSRVLAAQGQEAQARQFSERVAQIQAAFGDQAAAKERRASQVHALNAALTAGDFTECEALVMRFVPTADEAFAEELYQFLERLYRKAGRESEIQSALERARAARNQR